jgi:hypothetical protein
VRLDDQHTQNRMHYRARHSRSVDSARPCEIPRTPPPAGRTGIRCRGIPADTAGQGHWHRSWRDHQPVDSLAEFCLIFDPVPGIPRRCLNACPGSSQTWSVAGRRLLFIVLLSIRSPRRAAAGPSCAGLIRAGRRLLSTRFPPSGVTGHHPYGLFTRVITAESLPPRRSGWDWPGRGVDRRVRASRARGRGRPLRRGPQRPVCGTGRVGGSSRCSARHRAAGRSHGATIGWPAAEGPLVLWR